ncbi:hypothetical protein ACTXT7_016099 [Hymenolepis weldensis]
MESSDSGASSLDETTDVYIGIIQIMSRSELPVSVDMDIFFESEEFSEGSDSSSEHNEDSSNSSDTEASAYSTEDRLAGSDTSGIGSLSDDYYEISDSSSEQSGGEN